jgi:hypothetical protein
VSEQPPPDRPPDNGEVDDNGIEKFLDRFATREARLILVVTKWFSFVAFVAIGIEVLVAILDDFPKLHFVNNILDALGKLALMCDATIFSVFLVVATLAAVHRLLTLIGIDLVAFAKWAWRRLFRKRK